ncbi:unnamed protein product [Phytophthora lilii]|uniref:Unnamed protein product n=1 Tax=Phytophthora lilii TaxID=2077276 RepID=A0A9W6TPB8_9STRA|nr:unnamed protein product [Phytophthora lilii]
MSFLVEQEDNTATLDEVVAFIDSWDAGNASPGDATTSESESDSSPFGNEDIQFVLLDSLGGVLEEASFLSPKEKKPLTKPTAKKRKKASTRLQRRKKAEILSLRAQSEQLEGKLKQLKRIYAGPTNAAGSHVLDGMIKLSSTSWSAIAATQYQERLQSEKTNQQLRLALMQQMKVNKALREAFQMHSSLDVSTGSFLFFSYNSDLLFESKQHWNTIFGLSSPATRTPLAKANSSLNVIGELETMVEGLYLDSEAVLQPKGAPLTNNLLSVKQDKSRGRVFEIAITTPMLCSMEEASMMFWRDMMTIRQYNDKYYNFRWTVISRDEDKQQPSSVARSLVQLFAEYSRESLLEEEDFQDIEDLVLVSLSNKLREYLQNVQEKIALEAERMPALDAFARSVRETSRRLLRKVSPLGSSNKTLVSVCSASIQNDVEPMRSLRHHELLMSKWQHWRSCSLLSIRDEVGDYALDGSESLLVLDQPSSAITEGGCHQAAVQKKAPNRRRKRVGWSSSTGLQRRKRAELEFLRQHVLDLETYVQQLKSPCVVILDSIKTESRSTWKELAVAQYAKRLHFEKVNRALKTLINSQVHAHDALRNVFDEILLCPKDSMALPVGSGNGQYSA